MKIIMELRFVQAVLSFVVKPKQIINVLSPNLNI